MPPISEVVRYVYKMNPGVGLLLAGVIDHLAHGQLEDWHPPHRNNVLWLLFTRINCTRVLNSQIQIFSVNMSRNFHGYMYDKPAHSTVLDDLGEKSVKILLCSM